MTARWWIAPFAVLALGVSCAAALAERDASEAAVQSSDYYGAARESVGDLLSAAGDVNGDKLADFVTSSRTNRGAVVVFGSRSNKDLDLARLKRRGFRILAPGVAGGVKSIGGAGDVNRDGLADLIVGTPLARDSGGVTPGSAYVVFGKRSRSAVNLTRLGNKGFRIVGERRGDRAGAGVAGAGDINGDGLHDVIVGAPMVEVSDRNNAGSVYVVFGKRGSSTVELSTLGAAGVKIAGARTGEQVGNAVARVPDMDGDTLDEIVVGASRSDVGGNRSGAVYVVYGRRAGGAVNLAQIGSKGFLIKGAAAREGDGFAVAGLRDVDGDKLGDIAIGAPAARHRGPGSGSAYVVFGRPAPGTVDLAKLRSAGFRLDGQPGDVAGFSVSGTADESRDGRGELVVGAPGTQVGRARNAGTAYVVYGTGARKPRRLTRLGDGGFRLSRMSFPGAAGTSVAEVGDANGDGRSEVMVGAPGANYDGRMGSGAAYLFRGL